MSAVPTLKVLSLEDSSADFDIIHYQLANAGYDLDMLRVETERDFEAAIRKNKYDVILSDFNLPGFDGFGALRLCNEICPNVPFICVSGSIGEETAIELLKLGAIDYVLKDKPERLPLTIKRALDEVKEKEILRKAQAQLRKLSRAVDQSTNSIIITDLNGTVEYANPTVTKLTGYTWEELIGNNPRVFRSDETPDEEYAQLWETIKSGKEWIGEFHNKKKSGELFWESATISPIQDENGKITNFLAIKKDITEDKKLIIELIQAKEQAEESDRLKSAFLANMSHEIRTPMNGILGFAELLKEPGLTVEMQEEYLKIIEKSGARMLNIINDIVDISKIESGQMKLLFSETDVNDQLEFIFNFFKSEVQQKGLQLTLKNQLPSSKTIITTDREKLYAILTNLVKNAIKYTREGSIEFGCGSTLRQAQGNAGSVAETVELLQFYVRDTGIGIPKSRQEAIFDRFVQADIIDIMARQGAGLGLSISKAYTEMLGGRIWVESEEGKGSTFYFTLPCFNLPEKEVIFKNETITNNQVSQVKKLKILVAEDDESSSHLISISIKKFAKEIIIVQTGTESVEACLKHPDIDLVLMDIQMPEMDGYEATRQIRKFNPSVVIIAQTAYALSGDREKAIESGCTDYISKPSRKAKLEEIILKYFMK